MSSEEKVDKANGNKVLGVLAGIHQVLKWQDKIKLNNKDITADPAETSLVDEGSDDKTEEKTGAVVSAVEEEGQNNNVITPEPQIFDKQIVRGMVKRKGFGDEENSWEPEVNPRCPNLIQKFEGKCEQKRAEKEIVEIRKNTKKRRMTEQLPQRNLVTKGDGGIVEFDLGVSSQQQQCYQAATPGVAQSFYQPYQQQQQQPFEQLSFHKLRSQQATTAVMTTHKYTETPTIMEGPFDSRADAQVLRKAMKGFRTDDASIIKVLGRRTSNQRQQIAQTFKSGFGRDLVKDLKNELVEKLEEVVIAVLTPRVHYLAQRLNKAISGIGTKERTLVDVLCTATNAEIMEINRSYYRLFGRPLEKDLVGKTSGHFQRMVVSVNIGVRNEDTVPNPTLAAEDAQTLYQVREMRMGWGKAECAFNMVLATRSFAQIRLMLPEHERIAGHSLEKAISNDFSGNVVDGLLAVVKSAKNRAAYFAERLHNCISGIGNKEDDLIFICVTRAEVDMENIKNEYNKMYHKSLAEDISGNTSGGYKTILMTLIGC